MAPFTDNVLTDDVSRTVYSTDNSVYQLVPAAVAVPDTVAKLQQLLEDNHASDAPSPIVARGGGTGTNGQSLTNGTMVDLKRKLNRVVNVDVEAGTAVVEPGVVTASLNAQLAEHGLYWAPHTSTLNRATVGGMISTDAAGKGSLVHGRAHRHVLRLETLLVDGTPWVAEPVTVEEAEHRAQGFGAGAELWRRLLAIDIDDDSTFDLPELARGFSGYGIDRFRRDGLIDPLALLCGAEGTLAIITKATLKLEPLPTKPILVVASYDTFLDALTDAVRLRNTGPSAIESFDEVTLDRGRASPAWPSLGEVVGDHRGAVLLLEYTANQYTASEPAAVDGTTSEILAGGLARSVGVVQASDKQASIWKVRADAVGLLAKVATGGPEMSARPTAFVEDCAVPVAAMPAFIGEFRELLDNAGVVYGMFGHADVGCVHVRPALDLAHADQRSLLASLTEQVTALVNRHNGLLWGEHGRGFRGASISEVLDAETHRLMRSVKSAFDPLDLLNPGKLYRPLGSKKDLIAVAEAPMRGARDEAVKSETRQEFSHAFACNGNGLCHHYGGAEVMCPSYKASNDPALSPKGRADLIREWLGRRSDENDAGTGRFEDIEQFEDALADNLNQCLSCSACTGRCPVEVDIPELKSQFLEAYFAKRRRPLSHHLMSQFESLASLAAKAPRLGALGTKPAERLLGLVDLPAPSRRAPRRSRQATPKFDPSSRPADKSSIDVVVLPDVFTSLIDPETLDRAVRLLTSLDYSVSVAPFIESGKFDHVKGKRERFRSIAEKHEALLSSIAATGAVATVVEPAIALLHQHEYPNQVAGYPSETVSSITDLIMERSEKISSVGVGRTVDLFQHCTELSTAPQAADGWRRILEAAGFEVRVPAIGCCGMAGIFGHERENQAMSRRLWDSTWRPAIDDAVDNGRLVVAPGYSCRSQTKRFGKTPVPHPLELMMDQHSD